MNEKDIELKEKVLELTTKLCDEKTVDPKKRAYYVFKLTMLRTEMKKRARLIEIKEELDKSTELIDNELKEYKASQTINKSNIALNMEKLEEELGKKLEKELGENSFKILDEKIDEKLSELNEHKKFDYLSDEFIFGYELEEAGGDVGKLIDKMRDQAKKSKDKSTQDMYTQIAYRIKKAYKTREKYEEYQEYKKQKEQYELQYKKELEEIEQNVQNEENIAKNKKENENIKSKALITTEHIGKGNIFVRFFKALKEGFKEFSRTKKDQKEAIENEPKIKEESEQYIKLQEKIKNEKMRAYDNAYKTVTDSLDNKPEEFSKIREIKERYKEEINRLEDQIKELQKNEKDEIKRKIEAIKDGLDEEYEYQKKEAENRYIEEKQKVEDETDAKLKKNEFKSRLKARNENVENEIKAELEALERRKQIQVSRYNDDELNK